MTSSDEEPVSALVPVRSSAVAARRRDEEAAFTNIDEMGHDEEVGATQVDRESSIFDMTVADSPEDDVPREVSRRRRRPRRRVQDGAEKTPSTRLVRRLVLVQSQQSTAVPAPTPIDWEPDNPGFEEDTETVDCVSVGGDEKVPEVTLVGPPNVTGRPARGLQEAFASMDLI